MAATILAKITVNIPMMKTNKYDGPFFSGLFMA
jgi:hypothetical protein